MQHRHPASRRGFTLVEILVVLAIIAVLAGILFPVFGSAREAARTATCSSNLKQIYLGTQMYVRDSNGTYPTTIGASLSCGWPSLLRPYVSSTEVFECPNAENGQFRDGCPPDEEEGNIKWDGSYDYNLLRVGKKQFIREALVTNPSKAMLFRDGEGRINTPYGEGAQTGPEGTFNSYESHIKNARDKSLTERGHNGGFNICFADGHIKRLDADQFNSRDLWLNARDEEYNLRAP